MIGSLLVKKREAADIFGKNRYFPVKCRKRTFGFFLVIGQTVYIIHHNSIIAPPLYFFIIVFITVNRDADIQQSVLNHFANDIVVQQQSIC